MEPEIVFMCKAKFQENEIPPPVRKTTYKKPTIIPSSLGGALCSRESSCVSINYKKSGLNKGKCELDDKLMEESEENRRKNCEYGYLELVSNVSLFMQVECLKPFFAIPILFSYFLNFL